VSRVAFRLSSKTFHTITSTLIYLRFDSECCVAMVLVIETPHGANGADVMLVIIIGGDASATDVSEIDPI
jgi:hypothetical protein